MQAFLTVKDLARNLAVSVRTVSRMAQRLGVPPTIPSYACNRWSNEDAERLIERWQKTSQQRLKSWKSKKHQ